MDITITHNAPNTPNELTADVQKQLTAIADKHLQTTEWRKYMRPNKKDKMITDTTIQTKNFLLVPTIIDTHPKCPNNRPYAKIMYHKAITLPSPTAILKTADT